MIRNAVAGLFLASFLLVAPTKAQEKRIVLKPELMKPDISYFNSLDSEDVVNAISNEKTYEFLSKQIPLFDCPDSAIKKIYYYRWWTMRKHLKKTPDGYVFTEFLTPMKHGGKYNAISSAVGLQLNEARWFYNQEIVKQYANFWLNVDANEAKPHLHNFSNWLAWSFLDIYKVDHQLDFVKRNLQALNKDYHQWEDERQNPDQTFWQYDVRDAMEESISGGRREKNVRPTINSYMYGSAKAMSIMAGLAGVDSLKAKYQLKAEALKNIVETKLWNSESGFFEVVKEKGGFAQAREAIGFIPWYFNLPADDKKYEVAWHQLVDTAGFCAPWGLTTAERRHPGFRTHGSGHGCEWDGAIWPYATTQTLTALSNYINNYKNHDAMSADVFYKELHKYAMAHVKQGNTYIGEYQDEKTGQWLKGNKSARSRFYHHSSYVDLVISDLIGLKPQIDDTLLIQPLVPQNKWDWFCLDGVQYHGKTFTIIWDKDGKKYGKGKGFLVFQDGKRIHKSNKLKSIKKSL
ncbi:MGH1-like glycoside hydrolase domain-containing protein [Pelobium manganitolerans]|uniref:MGH1-like glycoside hydrolase domain-containing protein n=1 Tax=Pelobium manganitolerans TaxID=1842495 RepID=UPI003FA3CB59